MVRPMFGRWWVGRRNDLAFHAPRICRSIRSNEAARFHRPRRQCGGMDGARACTGFAGHRLSRLGIPGTLQQSPQCIPRRSGGRRLCRGAQCRDRVSMGGRSIQATARSSQRTLARRQPAVIVAAGGAEVALAAKSATTTIPIVFEMGGDPIALGVVDSLSRPGGNLTGVSSLSVEVSRKRLEFMREVRPGTKLFAVAVNSASPTSDSQLANLHTAADSLGLELVVLKASAERDFDGMFAAVHEKRAGGLVFSSDPYFAYRSQQLAELAVRHAVPAITQSRDFPLAGGLMSYGGDFRQSHRQAGVYAGRILNGREAFRFAGAARHQSRAVHQSEGRQRPRHNLSAIASEQRRRGHRMIWPAGRRAISTTNPNGPPRTSLFKKYFRALFAAVVVPLVIAGASEAWFGYRDQRARLNDLLDAEARLAAVKIEDFIEGIREQLGWTVQLPWSENTGREPQARRLAPAAPGSGRCQPESGRCRRQGAAVRVAHRPQQDRRRHGPVREPRRHRELARTGSGMAPSHSRTVRNRS